MNLLKRGIKISFGVITVLLLLTSCKSPTNASLLQGKLDLKQIFTKNSSTVVEKSTEEQILTLIKSHSSKGGSKETLDKQITDLLDKRNSELSELVVMNSPEISKRLFTEEQRNKLPTSMYNSIEKPVEVSGVLDVMHADDFQNNKAYYQYTLTTEKGEVFQVGFLDGTSEELPKQKVTIKGLQLDKFIFAPSSSPDAMKSTPIIDKDPLPVSNLIKVGIIYLNFQDQPNNFPYHTSEMSDQIFHNPNNVKQYFDEVSYGKYILTSHNSNDASLDTYGIYTLNINSPVSCIDFQINLASLKQLALNEATQDGFNSLNYDRIVFGMPQIQNCTWSGMGLGHEAWIFGVAYLRVLAHELGHTFGAAHSGSYSCNNNGTPVSVGTQCIGSEYGNIFDVMGSAQHYHFSSPQKLTSEMIPSQNTRVIQSSGTYTLAPIETNSSQIQVLKIPIETYTRNTQTSMTGYYYVEYRKPIGFDTPTWNTDPNPNGVFIYAGGDLTILPTFYPNMYPSNLLDMNPVTSSLFDAPLSPSQTFQDSGISITNISTNNNQAIIQVNMPPGICQRINPTMLISPNSQDGNPGSTKTYFIHIHNRDSATCRPAKYHMSGDPIFNSTNPNWTFNFPGDVVLNPGDSVTNTLTVTTPANANLGSYTFNLVYKAVSTIFTSEGVVSQSTTQSAIFNVIP